MNEKREMLINMAAAMATFFVQVGISFVLTPYITAELGAEAYGFVTLSNTLVGYIAILTIAVTSMSSRFISIEYFRGEEDSARKYYSSTMASLIVCIAVLGIPCLLVICAIDQLLQITPALVKDVQILMVFVLASFSLSMLSSNLSIGFYVKNKLYIGSAITAVGHLVRAALMIVMFMLLPTSVSFVGIATFLSTALVQSACFIWKTRLLPNMKFRRCDVSLEHLRKVIKSGVWNSITQLGAVLSMGLDLVVCNLYLGGTAMGMLSIARVIRQAIDSIGAAMMGAFQPTLTRYYADNDIDGLVAYAKWSMRVFGLVIALPVGSFIAFGKDFFILWVPNQNASALYPIALMAIAGWTILAPVAIIHNIFTVINRIRTNSLLICLGGFCIVGVECALLQATDYGVIVIAITSCMETVIRNLAYTIPSGARYLGKPWWTFFPCVGQSLLCTTIVVVCCLVVRFIWLPTTWLSLIIEGLCGVFMGGSICLLVLFGKTDREQIFKLVLNRISRGK